MKNSFLVIALACITLSIGCKKDCIPAISGVYIGTSHQINTGLREVFTSPSQSHVEQYADTLTYIDTLFVSKISEDSFKVETLFQLNQAFAFDDVADTLHVSQSFPSYFSKDWALFFDQPNQKLTAVFNSETFTGMFWSKTDFQFVGTKQ